jgi:predicted nuclease with TOPRIM domain
MKERFNLFMAILFSLFAVGMLWVISLDLSEVAKVQKPPVTLESLDARLNGIQMQLKWINDDMEKLNRQGARLIEIQQLQIVVNDLQQRLDKLEEKK